MLGAESKASLIAICTGVVLVNIAMVGASAAATLVAADALGAAWSGAPNAAHVLGTALGALGLAAAMSRGGRRVGLLLGYAVALLGALCACFGVVAGSIGALVVGMLLLGIGNAAAQLARYAAAELFPLERRGVVVGGVVWGGTVGAIVGPNLMAPMAAAVGERGLPGMVGPYVVALLAMLGAGIAAVFVRRSAPSSHAPDTEANLGLKWQVLEARPTSPSAARVAVGRTSSSSLRLGPESRRRFSAEALGQRAVLLPMAAMVAANFSMVAVMTMTPVVTQLHGLGLHAVGGIISAHMVGMFALSPVSGRLADQRGGESAIHFGVIALVFAASLCAVAPATEPVFLSLGVFLLGLGWNLCWVGGSSLLARDLPEQLQVQVQGGIDAVVWSTSTVASLASGAVLATGGFAALSVVGGTVILAPVIVAQLLRTRGHESARLQPL